MNQSAKKIIVEFLTKKREIINELTDTKFYLYDDDINDIINLSENECIEILKKLFINNHIDNSPLNNSSICPHCIIAKISKGCGKCKYAERHRNSICNINNINNDFGIIISIIMEKYGIISLYNINEIKELCDKTIEIKNNFFKDKNI